MKLNAESLKTGGHWLGATSGAGVPALTFFSSFPPPLFPGVVSLLTAGLSGAVLLIAAAWKPPADTPDQSLPRVVRRAKWFLVCSISLLIVYILLLQFTTIRIPTEPDTRLQIGFGKVDWTLTEVGKSWNHSNPSLTVTEMVKNEAAFTQDRAAILWQTWSIYLAGVLLIALYFFGFLTWTSAFALLARQRSIESRKKQ
jgi:hypothetical protein